MRVVLDSNEIENLADDVWLKVDSIIHNGIELVSCEQSGRKRHLRSEIESASSFVHGMIRSLGRLGLRSVVSILRDNIRSRLCRDRYGYEDKVDCFVFSCIQDFFFD